MSLIHHWPIAVPAPVYALVSAPMSAPVIHGVHLGFLVVVRVGWAFSGWEVSSLVGAETSAFPFLQYGILGDILVLLKINKKLIKYVRAFACMFVCALCVHLVPIEIGRECRIPLGWSLQVHCECWESNPRLLEEQQVLLTAEPSLQLDILRIPWSDCLISQVSLFSLVRAVTVRLWLGLLHYVYYILQKI